MSTGDSEIEIVPYRQTFVGISTVQDLGERDPVQVNVIGSFIEILKRPK